MYWNGGSGERVYRAIKARVIAFEFPQGERIYLDPLAADLGVSTTPVREALNRLAAQNLVIKAPRKGFIAVTLMDENLLGHYEITRFLLCHEVEMLDAETRRNLPEYEPIAVALSRLKRPRQPDAGILARYTGRIFAHIATLRKHSLAIQAIETANDHLYYVRTVECQHLDDVHSELARFCELLLAGDCEGLISAIEAYHDRRLELLPELMETLGR